MTRKDLEQALEKIPQIAGLRLSVECTGTQGGSTALQLVSTYKRDRNLYNVNSRSDLNTSGSNSRILRVDGEAWERAGGAHGRGAYR